ncbi:MAG TPA: hypothetical protein DCY88_03530 [Cyanobacteria bacterium UBA11372]|nr:hypothetical protein [Cyanobacteria bacterium UBA11372]
MINLKIITIKQGTGNGQQAAERFKWGFIPHLKLAGAVVVGVSSSQREQEIGKTVKSSLLRVPFFDKSQLPITHYQLPITHYQMPIAVGKQDKLLLKTHQQ